MPRKCKRRWSGGVTKFDELLNALNGGGVDFILVGGLAANAHGSPRLTKDLDIVYSRARTNLQRLVAVLTPLHPHLRGAPEGLPFIFDVPTLKAGLNFTLITDLGWIDLLGEITGGGSYDQLLPHSIELEAFGLKFKVLDLETLIRTKRAAGRPKDFEGIAELELLRDRAKPEPA